MPISLALPVSLVSLTNGAAGAERRVGTGAAAEKAVSGSEKPEAFAAASGVTHDQKLANMLDRPRE